MRRRGGQSGFGRSASPRPSPTFAVPHRLGGGSPPCADLNPFRGQNQPVGRPSMRRGTSQAAAFMALLASCCPPRWGVGESVGGSVPISDTLFTRFSAVKKNRFFTPLVQNTNLSVI